MRNAFRDEECDEGGFFILKVKILISSRGDSLVRTFFMRFKET